VTSSHIPGVPRGDWSDEVRALLLGTVDRVHAMEGEHGAEDREPLAILPVIAQQPRLLGPFLGWAAAIALEGALARRDHELLALRTASNCDSPFEWVHHVRYALAAGLTEEEVERVPTAGYDGWGDRDATLLRVADELHGEMRIGDETWAALVAAFDAAALVEVALVVGQYTMLSMLANVAGLRG
jgi:4-carboxymuconolactone decarboxylase